MTNWIKHDGGPQPVADDVWVRRLKRKYPSEPILSAPVMSGPYDRGWNDVVEYQVLNQHLIDAARKEGLQTGLKAFDEARLAVEGDIQKLCDAARLEGIRLGLEAAHAALWSIAIGPDHSDEDWEDAIGVTELIRALDPETIAREAQGER